jgi:polysaccharide export outer membrane protein
MIARTLSAGFALALTLTFAPLAAPADTSIAPGDVLDVQVFGEQALTQQLTVARDGSITLPLVGRIVVQGKSTTDAAHMISSGLERYVRHPIVQVGIKSEGMYNVLVLGNVKTPGRYTIQAGSRVTDAIAAAGGLGPVNGLMPAARVSVNENVKQVPLEALLRHGDLAQNLPLADGAAVYVPAPATIKVRVLGAVDHPGEIDVNQGDRLAVAIAKAGNSTQSNADLNHIKVTRNAVAGQPSVTEVNLYKSLSDGDLKSDMLLVPDDVIYVPKARGNPTDAAASGILGVLRRLFIPF